MSEYRDLPANSSSLLFLNSISILRILQSIFGSVLSQALVSRAFARHLVTALFSLPGNLS